jgi:hypothetical protein
MSSIVTLVKGDSYAVHTGAYAGEILVYIQTSADDFCFLAIPTMINRDISKLIFENAYKKKIIKFVERLPSKIIRICVEQYKRNKSNKCKI